MIKREREREGSPKGVAGEAGTQAGLPARARPICGAVGFRSACCFPHASPDSARPHNIILHAGYTCVGTVARPRLTSARGESGSTGNTGEGDWRESLRQACAQECDAKPRCAGFAVVLPPPRPPSGTGAGRWRC